MDAALQCFKALHSDLPSRSTANLFGVAMLIITAVSIILNVFIAVIICGTALIDKSIRPHIASLVAASLIFLSSNCLVLLPTQLAGVMMVDPYNIILSVPNTLGYLLIMFTTSTMAFDRFLIFFSPKSEVMLRTAMRWYIFTALPCFLALLLTIHMNMVGCYKRVNPYRLGFTYSCSDCGSYTTTLPVLAFTFSGVNFVVYLAIFIKIMHMNKRVNYGAGLAIPPVKKRDVKLVVQFSLICAAQFIGSSSFYFLPPLSGNSEFSFYLTTIFSSMNTMTNPCVIIAFNRNVRCLLWALFTTIGVRQVGGTIATSKFQQMCR